MRPLLIAAVPLVAGMIATPAAAQVSARVHIDIPIGRPGSVVYSSPRRPIVVREYDPYRDGSWQQYYGDWVPVTVYYYDGYYYDYPIVPYAEPIVVYRYRGDLFLAPPQREFAVWREQYRAPVYRRDNDRDDRRYQSQRDDRDGRDVRPVQPQRDDRNGRDIRPVQPQRDGRDIRPAQPQRDDRNGRQAPPTRDAGRSRSRPH